jgi:uncharacterized protein involved in exopolysaccharide biosynthesis
MRAPFPASPDDIVLGVAGLGAKVGRSLPQLLIATVAIGALSCAGLSVLTPKYVAQVQIEILAKGSNNAFDPHRDASAPELLWVRMDREAIATHVRALQSRGLALKLAADLELTTRPEFNAALVRRGPIGRALHRVGLVGPRAGQSEEELVLAACADALRVYQIKDTRGIMIEFRSSDPKLAAAAANKLAELYRDDLARRAVLIKTPAEEVAAAEVAPRRGQASIADGSRDENGRNEQPLGQLNGELTEAATVRAEAQARAREARDIAARGAGETLPDVRMSQTLARLVEERVRVERQIAELPATLLPTHPRMQKLNADVARLNRQINDEVDKIVDGLEREAKAAALPEDGARRRLAEAKARVVAGADDVELRALDNLAKSKRARLVLQAQLESARTTSDARAVPAEVAIVSRARPSSERGPPKVGMVTLLAMTATLLLGLALGLTRELLAIARAGPRVVATGDGRPAPAAANGWRPARTMPSLARQLIAGATGRTGFRTLVTGEGADSAAGGEAIALALELADRQQQVILLDWSLDGVGLAFERGVSPTLGMSDVLLGRASFEDVIERLAQSDAHVIAAGSSAAGIAAALDKDRVNMLLDALDDAYDHVVIAGGRDALSDLFTTIDGRIDAGVVVAVGKGAAPVGNFLGFNVADLDVIRYEPGAPERGEANMLTASGAWA